MPSETPWTPGPWKYDPMPGYQYVVEIDRKEQILLVAAAVPPGREQEIQANARLAAAAPEMYAALEAILDDDGDWLEAMGKARRLLEKLGEQTDAE